ncbi:hypothetical protein [Derxia gummosa]|uniref:Type VI secretion system protein n=1 Tax=Derxia gummosa DSM 723 TaxID=1121388 RepID=A0A8B6X9G6_9BURK|nr:hypothetical protein [Derxia gummosa]
MTQRSGPRLRTSRRDWLRLAALSGLLGGCSTVGDMASVVASSTANAFSGGASPAFLRWKGLLVVADPDANDNSAVALDIVFAADAGTLDRLLALPANKWFATRAELLRSFPAALAVRSYEFVPGQTRRLTEQELGSPRVAGVVLFADYRGPGEHRQRLPAVREGGLVALGARDFNITATRL